MADVQTGRFGKLLQAAFNLKQRMTLGQTLPDVMPVFDLERRNPEMQLHAGVDLCAGCVVQAAVAAEYSSAYLYLPTTSKRVAVLERVIVSNNVGVTVGYSWSLGGASAAPEAAGTFSERYRDGRKASQGNPAAQLRQGTSPASIFVNPEGVIVIPNGASEVIEGPWVLGDTGIPSLPNSFFQVEASTVNLGLTAVFVWYERNLDPGELVL